jgi:hypothetical protein
VKISLGLACFFFGELILHELRDLCPPFCVWGGKSGLGGEGREKGRFARVPGVLKSLTDFPAQYGRGHFISLHALAPRVLRREFFYLPVDCDIISIPAHFPEYRTAGRLWTVTPSNSTR